MEHHESRRIFQCPSLILERTNRAQAYAIQFKVALPKRRLVSATLYLCSIAAGLSGLHLHQFTLVIAYGRKSSIGIFCLERTIHVFWWSAYSAVFFFGPNGKTNLLENRLDTIARVLGSFTIASMKLQISWTCNTIPSIKTTFSCIYCLRGCNWEVWDLVCDIPKFQTLIFQKWL